MTYITLFQNIKSNLFFTYLVIIFSLTAVSIKTGAQPSGGPYGPIPQNFTLPDVSGTTYFVSPNGKEGNSGENADKPTTIEEAIAKVETGDAIVLRGGTYRTGNLILNQGITMQAFADEIVILKGTFIADDWNDLGNGLWTTKWEHFFPMKPQGWWRRETSGISTPIHRFNNDMVFTDGRFLQSAGWEGEVDENSFYIDYESGTVYIGLDPKNHLIEITAFDLCLHRTTDKCHGKTSDGKGPVIRGITFTQYAYRAIEIDGTNPEGISSEANHGKEVTGTLLEHCEISYCSRVAAYLRGDNLTMRHCKVSNTSTEGIFILSSSDVLLEKNIFTKNNIEKIHGYFPAAVKIFNQCYRVTCNDNLVIDLPYSNGIWYDVGNVDGVFTNNWIEGVGIMDAKRSVYNPWPAENGFFFEISKGAICAGNVFVNCSHGIMSLNSSGVKICQNTFVNSSVAICRDERIAKGDHFGWHASSGPDFDKRDEHVFKNNLMSNDENYIGPMLLIWQKPSICGQLTKPQLTELDNNVYIRSINMFDKALILYGPAKNEECYLSYTSPEKMHEDYPNFASKSRSYVLEKTPLFQGYHLGDYRIASKFPGTDISAPIPEYLKTAYPVRTDKKFIGAYPMDEN